MERKVKDTVFKTDMEDMISVWKKKFVTSTVHNFPFNIISITFEKWNNIQLHRFSSKLNSVKIIFH